MTMRNQNKRLAQLEARHRHGREQPSDRATWQPSAEVAGEIFDILLDAGGEELVREVLATQAGAGWIEVYTSSHRPFTCS